MRRHRKPVIREGCIYLLRPGAEVTIRGTSSIGGASFTANDEMYVMCTFAGKIGFMKGAPWYTEGVFVEPSVFGCLKNTTEVVFSVQDISDGPFTEEDMTVNPMLGVFRPMTKRRRRRLLKNSRRVLEERDGIRMSDKFINKADVSGFMEMHRITLGDGCPMFCSVKQEDTEKQDVNQEYDKGR